LTLLALGAAFLAFMALISGVHALDHWSLRRFGYAPFALVNVVSMLVPSGALLAALASMMRIAAEGTSLAAPLGQADPLWLLVPSICAGLVLAWLVWRRTNVWVALAAAALLLVAAPALAFSVLFRTFAAGDQAAD